MARLHRFYLDPKTSLVHDLWLRDERLLWQWNKVLRFRPAQELVLFDGVAHEKLYRLEELNATEAHIVHVTDFERKLPKQKVYLLWALLKKDKNDWVLQKCTELGVSHFVPLLADRSEKTGFNVERAQKIVIEAAEQCGRSDIPDIREPMQVASAIDNLADHAMLYICEQTGSGGVDNQGPTAVLIGPEGGWSDEEKELFGQKNIKHLALHDFTLRAETAAVAAAQHLLS